ncbi:histamine N-methyltransferase-like [Ptychodera flava]|uniref:histamine N-methyltransferase-like n=1 Tax=Ptychodera flava TaxID=63121 RepID=UPI003969E900
MAVETKLLMNYEHEFFERYSTLCRYRRTTFYEEQQWRLKNTFQDFSFCKDTAISVLAIGSGDGTKDVYIIDALAKKVDFVDYVVVEPSESEIQKFKTIESSKQDRGEWKNVRLTYHQMALEEFLGKPWQDKENYFDIIIAIHCAYFISNPGQIFHDLYKILKKGGTLFNTMSVDAWEKILQEAEKHHSCRTISSYGSMELRQKLGQTMPNVNMKILRRKNGIGVDECFREESKDGNDILDFILQIVDVRKNIPEEIVDKLLIYLREKCCHSVDGKLYFDADDEDIIIVKE